MRTADGSPGRRAASSAGCMHAGSPSRCRLASVPTPTVGSACALTILLVSSNGLRVRAHQSTAFASPRSLLGCKAIGCDTRVIGSFQHGTPFNFGVTIPYSNGYIPTSPRDQRPLVVAHCRLAGSRSESYEVPKVRNPLLRSRPTRTPRWRHGRPVSGLNPEFKPRHPPAPPIRRGRRAACPHRRAGCGGAAGRGGGERAAETRSRRAHDPADSQSRVAVVPAEAWACRLGNRRAIDRVLDHHPASASRWDPA